MDTSVTEAMKDLPSIVIRICGLDEGNDLAKALIECDFKEAGDLIYLGESDVEELCYTPDNTTVVVGISLMEMKVMQDFIRWHSMMHKPQNGGKTLTADQWSQRTNAEFRAYVDFRDKPGFIPVYEYKPKATPSTPPVAVHTQGYPKYSILSE